MGNSRGADRRHDDRSISCSISPWAAARVVRSQVCNISDTAKYALYVDGTATLTITASQIIGGRSIQRTGGKISALNCELQKFANTGLLIDSTATVSPLIGNCIFGPSDQTPLQNSAAGITLDASNCYGNVFSATPAAAGVPAPVIPAASVLDRDPDTLVPFSWSALGGIGISSGVLWDYRGTPYRKSPAVGCCEVADF